MHPNEAVRKAAGEARLAITQEKRSFLSDESIFKQVKPHLDQILQQKDHHYAPFARGVLKKFAQIGMFHIESEAVRKQVQELYKELALLESKWKENVQNSTKDPSASLQFTKVLSNIEMGKGERSIVGAW